MASARGRAALGPGRRRLLPANAAGRSGRALRALSTPADEELLLEFKSYIDNWDEVAAAWPLVGWTACNVSSAASTCLPVCAWGAVECDPFEGSGNVVTAV